MQQALSRWRSPALRDRLELRQVFQGRLSKLQKNRDRLPYTNRNRVGFIMSEIKFSKHALVKLEILARDNPSINKEFVIEVIQNPDHIESLDKRKLAAQKRLNEKLLLRVIYRQYDGLILVITLYPGKRSRYEKD